MDPVTIALALATQFAPSILKYLTNSDTAGAVAAQVIDIAKTVTGKGTIGEARAVLELDPAKAVEFQLAVMQNDTDLAKAYLADIQNARARDMALAAAGVKNTRANALAIGAASLVLVTLVIVVWATNMDDFAKATITLICGRALGWVEQVFSFEFGTTRTSAKKDDTINNLTKS
ncbi:hypothetical protein SAMN06295970_117117 [Noviherbaspirillum suwonense]|uniref:Uncharacterized protein n=1 Tax=Noviherbaspirillum suwonense TaxID=1224511 RepID=A0ABY1QKB4_9BURK|nr:hypothetical protein SAMN06295970_117117 [Noviherbaspirillum suwonense]